MQHDHEAGCFRYDKADRRKLTPCWLTTDTSGAEFAPESAILKLGPARHGRPSGHLANPIFAPCHQRLN
jgi:hypothetical protein